MRRVPEFDALRGIAALGVLLFHFGMTGVHLFLVLSGFLITRIVIEHAGTPGFLRAFYARRILRIWPIYYLTLAFLVVLQRTLPGPPSLRGLPYYLTFTQFVWNWPGMTRLVSAPPMPIRAFNHTWTVALEEQFYLLWPLLLTWLGRRRVVPIVVGILSFGIWFKTLGFDTWILPNVFGAFALGALIAAILDDKARVDRHRGAFSAFFVVAGALGFAYVRWYYTVSVASWPISWLPWRDSLQNFAFYTLHFGIVGFVATNAGRWFLAPLRIKELTDLGEISYGMYLYHMPIYWLVGGFRFQQGEPWLIWVAKIALTCLAASLSYRYVEKPILRLKEWFPYGSKPLDEASSPIYRPHPPVVRSRVKF
jgi:peptidoglycan/LPS O-acetylase OafA/YrhL